MIDFTKITEEVLLKLNACSEGRAWWINNNLEGFPVKDLPKIKGDYRGYISWLKDKFYCTTYDQYGNPDYHTDFTRAPWARTRVYDNSGNNILYVNPAGDIIKQTFNKAGQLLTKRYFSGYWSKRTYNTNGNLLSYLNSDGLEIVKTYDARGNCTARRGSDGLKYEKVYDETGRLIQTSTQNKASRVYVVTLTYKKDPETGDDIISYKDSYKHSWITQFNSSNDMVYHYTRFNNIEEFRYDENHNCTYLKISDDLIETHEFQVTETELNIDNGCCIIPLTWRTTNDD